MFFPGRFLLYPLALIVLSLLPEKAAAQSATFRADLRHSGVYNSGEVKELHGVKWQFRTGNRIYSSPTLAGGTVYFGGEDSCLYAIDRSNGKLRWRFRTGGAVASTPAVEGNRVYFGSADGNFYALDAPSGKPVWSFKTGGERRFGAIGLFGMQPADQMIADTWDFYLSSPAVYKRMVYFGGGDGVLHALDRDSGRERWRFQTGGVVHSSPAVDNGLIYIGSWDACLYALKADTGDLVWKFKTGEDEKFHLMTGIQSSPVVAGGLVLVGARDANLYALEAKTGKEVWKFSPSPTWIVSSPAVSDSLVYFSTSDSHKLYALELRNGRQVFEFEASLFVFSSPALTEHTAVFGCFNGYLYALDCLTGRQLWAFQTESSRKDSLGVMTDDGRLEAGVFDGATGDDMERGVRKIHSLGSILSSPVIDSGEIYFTSTDGCLYAIY
ncbi:MAG: PQQ-binding-like beta-propeller repeat protein [Candidatus Glassbacteria bacterium]